jgi:ribosomal-protein-alanine N-acetyltransferase
METRLATEDDAPILAVLHEASFGAARWSAKQFADSLVLQTTQALLVSEGKSPYGFILFQVAGEDGEILTFCIEPNARHKGAGLFLLREALQMMRQKGARKAFLEVASDNGAALALYKKAGFCGMGKRARYYARGTERIDAVLMELSLNTDPPMK